MRGVQYQWQPVTADPRKVARLQNEAGLSPFIAALLVNRGVTELEDVDRFLNPRFEHLHDPCLMKGMDEVVARVERALDGREQILVYGDYDVDGITSTAVLKRALEMLGGRVTHYIPRRLEEGYGLRAEVVREACRAGAELIISVDSGIRDDEACLAARAEGIDLIITDHHLPGDKLPDAFAILNPRQPGCPYPDKNLAAVGVVLKLVQALFSSRGREEVVPHFLKMVAIGTVADMVPLVGENRTIAKLGLSALSTPYNVGLQALLRGSGVVPPVDHLDVGFRVAPRLNAFTRMGGGAEIVDLFSVADPDLARRMVEEMNRKNVQRRTEEERILSELWRRGEEDPELLSASFLLVWGDSWHRGVIGNVAARVVQKFYRPALVLSLDEDGGQGSGRSIPGFHLLNALQKVESFFERYGGHSQAAGVTVKKEFCNPEGLKQLSQALSSEVDTCLTPEALVPELKIDSVLPVESLSFDLCAELDRLGPFGVGNPVPLFASRNVPVLEGPWVLKEQHLKLRAQANGLPVDLIWWRNGEKARDLSPGACVDIVYTLQKDSFRGEDKLLLTLKDLRV